MTARLKGLKSGGNHAVMEVEAFGSRAESTWKGRGALPDSDLDIIIRDIPGAFETGGANKGVRSNSVRHSACCA